MKFIFACFLALASVVAVTEGSECSADYCAKNPCKNMTRQECCEKNKIYKSKGSLCGCCDTCVDKISKGGNCNRWEMKRASDTAEGEACTKCKQVDDENSDTCERQ